MALQELFMEHIRRDTEEILIEPELADRLKTGVPLQIKAGFDPTVPDLPLGDTPLPVHKDGITFPDD